MGDNKVEATSDTQIQTSISGVTSEYGLPSGSLNDIYDCIRVMVAERKFKKKEFITLLTSLFLLFERQKALTPVQRKAKIKALLQRILNEIPLSDEDKMYANMGIKLADPIIDMAHDLLYAKASQLIGKVKSSKCWTGCMKKTE